MARRPEDVTVWIGYADFLTTLAVLFFFLLVAVTARAGLGSAYLKGSVVNAESSTPIANCEARLGESRRVQTDRDGHFEFLLDSLRGRATVGLRILCDRFAEYSELLTLGPYDTIQKAIELRPTSQVTVETLSGDALFAPNEYHLKPEAVITVVNLGKRLKLSLAANELIAVQGHTDDIPFPAGAGKDNWVLSGERAAAAAKVLAEGAGIRQCQIAIMGFGPSRPLVPVAGNDGAQDRARKRAQNRRIEFRKVQGADLAGGRCAT